MSQIAPTPSVTRLADPTNPTPALGRVLVVEDDPAVQKVLKHVFEAEGYAGEIHGNGQSALESVHAFLPAIVVLEAEPPTPPIVGLSAASDLSDKIILLELGADDYVTKPLSPWEILGRVHAALRHTSRTSHISLVRFDNISVDLKRIEMLRDGEIVVLTAQEFKTLQFLVHNPDRMISRDELLKEVWGYQDYILRLRQKLECDLAPRTLPHGTREGLQVRLLRSSCSGAGAGTLHHAAF